MARLNDSCFPRGGGRAHASGLGEELSDRHRVGGVVRALVDHLKNVVWPKNRCSYLNAACPPAIWHRHLAAGEWDLIAGDRNRLENRAPDHPLGLLVEVSEIVDRRCHSAASCRDVSTRL